MLCPDSSITRNPLPRNFFRFFFAVLFFSWVLSAAGAESAAAPLEDLSDRRYLPRVIELIEGAARSIEVSLFQILLPEGEETHPVYRVLEALGRASGRGVRVRVLLNRSLDSVAGETVPMARSLAAYEFLTRRGVEVVFADTSKRLHDKLIVIDERWVIEGSMNWTKTALESNWESATLIDSPEYAAQKLARVRAIPLSPEKALDTLGEEGELLEIPALLMAEPRYFPDLLRRKDETIFEFYLGLLEERRRMGTGKFIFEDAGLFEKFHLDPARSQKDKRREAVRLLKKLKKRGLVDLAIPSSGANAEVALRPLKGDASQKFTLPVSYFEYGYPRRLSFAGEFAYLLARLEMALSPSPPWWWRSQEGLTRRYHLHHTTLAAGMLELHRENLIEIIRDDAPEGAPHSERLVNRYRVNRLESPAERQEKESRLIEKFGRENFVRARNLAEEIDEPHDPLVLETILQWMDRYPGEDLEAAFKQVSRYERNNPRRSLYYLHGILEGMREGRSLAEDLKSKKEMVSYNG